LVSDLEKIPHIQDVLAEKSEWWKPEESTKPPKSESLPDWIGGAYRVVLGGKNPVTMDNITYGDSPPEGISWMTRQESAKPKKESLLVGRKNSTQKTTSTQAPRVDYGKSVYIAQGCVALTISSILWQGFSYFTNGSVSLDSLAYVITIHGSVGAILIYFTYLISGIRETLTKINMKFNLLISQKKDLLKKLETVNESIKANKVQKLKVSELIRKITTLEAQQKTKSAELESEFSAPISEVESELKRINLSQNEEDGKLVSQMQTTIQKIEDRIAHIENNRKGEVSKASKQISKIQEETSALLQKLRLELHKKMAVEMCKVPINSGCIEGWMTSVTKLHQAGILNSSDIFEVEWCHGIGMICTKTNGTRVEFRGISKRMTQSLNDWLLALRKNSKTRHYNLAPEVSRQIRDDETKNIERLSEILSLKMDVFDSEQLMESREKDSEQKRFLDLREKTRIDFESRRKQVALKQKDIKNNYEKRYRELVEPLVSAILDTSSIILRKETEIRNESSNTEASKTALELKLSEMSESLSFVEMHKDAHKSVCFRHYLGRVFS
jgi:hypothetical protein